MSMNLVREGDVAVVQWDDGENRLNLSTLGRLNEILDEVETIDGPLALVLTGTGKFFSNGLDLGGIGEDAALFHETLTLLKRTVGRLLVFPAFTLAAINGHAFAGGALLSCAFDQRGMREDRGFWCINEVEIGLALDEQLWSILTNRLSRPTALRATTTAFRFGGTEALHAGIVEFVAPEQELLPRAIAVAQQLATIDRSVLHHQKMLAHGAEAHFLGFVN